MREQVRIGHVDGPVLAVGIEDDPDRGFWRADVTDAAIPGVDPGDRVTVTIVDGKRAGQHAEAELSGDARFGMWLHGTGSFA